MAVRLEVGKRYVRRDGVVTDEIEKTDKRHPLHDMYEFCDPRSGKTNKADGSYVIGCVVSDFDLVSEFDGEPQADATSGTYLIHVFAPPETYQMQRLAPHLQIPSDTPERRTYGPVTLAEHIVAGLQNPERQRELLSELVREHGHKIVRIELEKVS